MDTKIGKTKNFPPKIISAIKVSVFFRPANLLEVCQVNSKRQKPSPTTNISRPSSHVDKQEMRLLSFKIYKLPKRPRFSDTVSTVQKQRAKFNASNAKKRTQLELPRFLTPSVVHLPALHRTVFQARIPISTGHQHAAFNRSHNCNYTL
jgi:hypothetical protein